MIIGGAKTNINKEAVSKKTYRLKSNEVRRSGDDLLSRALRRSTISAKGFNGRVRNGIGWDTFAIITRSSNLTTNKKEKPHKRDYLYTKKKSSQSDY